MKCHVIVLDKRNAFPYFNAKYDHDRRLVEVFGRKFLFKGVVDRFHVDPDHIYEERGKFGVNNKKMPLIIIDNATRKSVDPETYLPTEKNPDSKNEEVAEVGSSVKLHSEEEVDQKERLKLNYLIEKAFWQALFEQYKLPFTKFLIIWGSGIGSWHLIRTILIALGLVEGVI